MRCLDENRVVEYLDRLLTDAARAEVEAHVDGCPACRAVITAAVRAGAVKAPPDAGRLEAGELVDHFQVLHHIGSGAMGDVYLCRDTQLGRRVALKTVASSALGSDEAKARFLQEARTTARFNHPHIVTIYAVGRFKGRPYLALEYLEGQTLRERTDQDRPGVREALRVALAIGEALVEAHRHDLLHRDLKPTNVIMPRDGRLRVVDFGLAKVLPSDVLGAEAAARPSVRPEGSTAKAASLALETSGARVCGTPAYMAPEQWLGLELTPACDIWALGTMLYEMLCGRRPFEHDRVAALRQLVVSPAPAPAAVGVEPLEPPLERLIASCLDKDPTARPTAEAVCATIRQLLHGVQTTTDELSPFRGLLPFGERHAPFFFGREAEIAAFVERAREQPVLPVVGPSGAGKSSFVAAGVVPRLRDQGSWLVLRLRPGHQPFETLAARLLAGESSGRSGSSARRSSSSFSSLEGSSARAFDEEQPLLADRLRQSPSALNLALRELAELQRTRVLLFVDQLEEIVTLVPEANERRRFIEAICAAAEDPDGPVRVIFTLRDDFLGRIAVGPKPREVLAQVTIIHQPDREALEEILVRPVEAAGYSYDDEQLPGQMIDELQQGSAALTLLQFSAQRLWDRRDVSGRLLLRAEYEALGGVRGALARHADAVLDGLPVEEMQLARRLLMRLVTPDRTRRLVSRARLLGGLDGPAAAVLDRLIEGRLVMPRRLVSSRVAPVATEQQPVVDGEQEAVQLELVHESLIDSWRRLARWIDEGREELALAAELEQAATIWVRRGRRADEVWTGDALQDALRRLERSELTVEPIVEAFLAAGRERQRRQRRRRKQRLALGAMALVAITVVSVAAALLLARQSREVAAQRDLARSQRAASQREGARAALMRGDLLQAWAKLRSSFETEDSLLARALWAQLRNNPQRWREELGGNAYDVAFSPDGEQVAVACQDKAIYIFDRRTRAARVLRGHQDQVFSVAWSPDGKRLASGSWKGGIRIWSLDGRVRSLSGHDAAVWRLTFSPDGKQLASASWDHTVRLWHLGPQSRGGASTIVLRGHTDRVYGVAFSPDGKRLASASFDKTVVLWDAEAGVKRRVLGGHSDRVYAVAWSPDGRLLASSSLDRTVRLWNLADSQSSPRVLHGHSAGVYGVDFSADGSLLASAGWDGEVGVWNVAAADPKLTRRLRGHSAGVYRVVFAPGTNGATLASGSSDKTVRLWDLSSEDASTSCSGCGVDKDAGHGSVTWSVAFSPDGKLLASSGLDQTVRLWDVASGEQRRVLRGHTALVTALAFSPDGQRLASASADRVVRVWEVVSGRSELSLIGHRAAVYGVAFSPDGQRLATGGSDRSVRLWRLQDGSFERLGEHADVVWGLAFSPDGRQVATASADRSIRLWPISSGAKPRVLRGHEGVVYGLAFSPDGRQLVSGSADGTVRLWDLDAGSSRVVGRHDGRVYYVDFHPDGKQVGAPASKGPPRIWRLADGQVRELRGHVGETNTLRFSPDGTLAATTSDDGTVRLWDAATAQPRWRTVLAAASSPSMILSHRGWQKPDGATLRQQPWQRQVATALKGAVSGGPADQQRVCVISERRQLQLWQPSSGRMLFAEPARDAIRMLALPGAGCAMLAKRGSVELYDESGAFKTLVHDQQARAIAADGGNGLLVAGASEVIAFDAKGKRRQQRWPCDVGVTALARLGPRSLLLGFQEGTLEVLDAGNAAAARAPAPAVRFEQTESSAVAVIRRGPGKTIFAGYANGRWGLWSEQGRRLLSGRLHGAIHDATLSDDRQSLLVTSELGQHALVDLSVFSAPYCELLVAIWKRADVAWDDGRARRRPPPPGHRCRR